MIPASTVRQFAALPSPGWGWAGTVEDFPATSPADCQRSLELHHAHLNAEPASNSQLTAWKTSLAVVHRALGDAVSLHRDAGAWGLVFEYELPLEGGRRPDLVVLAGSVVIVVEFKQETRLPVGYFDQVGAYARDLADYHSATRGLAVVPVLAPIHTPAHIEPRAEVRLAPPEKLVDTLTGLAAGPQIDLVFWTSGGYAPLPSLVTAARRIFQDEPLPHVRQALSARIPETVQLVSDLISDAESNRRRQLVLVGGVPGAGKTLVGLRVVYERAAERAPASFLSGNGPLVEVLQDALQSRVFVRDLHAYIRTYGIRQQTPEHNVVVFDEAQRAWDARYMDEKRGIARSEPELLIEAALRMPGWATLVGLVGQGQEIYSGEERGLSQWADAIRASGEEWEVVCAPRLAEQFAGLTVTAHEDLDLTISLRSRRAERLHLWVSALLGEQVDAAMDLAIDIQREGFPLWVTRDLDQARSYARDRYIGDDSSLYGLVASSQAKNLATLGIDNTFQATKRVRVARWFNDPVESSLSGRAMTQPITEFQCQGLELDLPILCWGDDLSWAGQRWSARPIRRKYPQDDPTTLLINSYRVLLTRGRDGLVIWVPPQTVLDATVEALQQAGVSPLPSAAAR